MYNTTYNIIVFAKYYKETGDIIENPASAKALWNAMLAIEDYRIRTQAL